MSMIREDLNHPQVSGNKWWKLKYNLERARSEGHHQLLTFGGAYSNHLYATAAAAREIGMESIGIVRGEAIVPLNPILSFASGAGMKLRHVSRADYRQKTEPRFLDRLRDEYGRFYLIPEGGTNALAVKGCRELGASLRHLNFDYICLSVGTGGTAAGIIEGLGGKGQLLGFSALKGGNFLDKTVATLLANSGSSWSNWKILTGCHFGGYGKKNAQVDRFIADFQREQEVPLDPIYTGKMMCGLFDLIGRNKFPSGVTILALHTGGVRAS